MGIYLNPGFGNLMTDRRSDSYIDKSMLIKELNGFIGKPDPLICVSRPRRFGKTMAANMLSAYYSKGCDSHEVFKGLKISDDPSFEEHINRYNVIYLDMNAIFRTKGKSRFLTDAVRSIVVSDIRKSYPELDINEDTDMWMAMRCVYDETGIKFIVIMDEYDVLVREKATHEEVDGFIDLLITLFKNSYMSEVIALAYITGILPIVRESFQSKLNNFREFTMVDAEGLAPFIGFTRDETEYLAGKTGMDMTELERWYDGYCVNGIELYSPKSVIEALRKKRCGDYWIQTGSYDAIRIYIEMNLYGIKDDVLKMMTGVPVRVNVSSYENKMNSFRSRDDVFTYLIHLGYLAYDAETETCRIPNNEVMNQWGNAIAASEIYVNFARIAENSRDLLDATLRLDSDAVAESLAKSHEMLTSNLSYNNEQSLQSAVMLAYFYARSYYTVIPECPAGKGYADVVMIPAVPGKPALVIELKKDKSAGGAIEQIKAKNYPSVLGKYNGDIILAGVNYDSKTKEHMALLEKA